MRASVCLRFGGFIASPKSSVVCKVRAVERRTVTSTHLQRDRQVPEHVLMARARDNQILLWQNIHVGLLVFDARLVTTAFSIDYRSIIDPMIDFCLNKL